MKTRVGFFSEVLISDTLHDTCVVAYVAQVIFPVCFPWTRPASGAARASLARGRRSPGRGAPRRYRSSVLRCRRRDHRHGPGRLLAQHHPPGGVSGEGADTGTAAPDPPAASSGRPPGVPGHGRGADGGGTAVLFRWSHWSCMSVSSAGSTTERQGGVRERCRRPRSRRGWRTASIVVWLVVLALGRMPPPLYEATAAVLRYRMRHTTYLTMLSSAYPKRLFGEEPGSEPEGPASGTRPLALVGAGRGLLVLFLLLGPASWATGSVAVSVNSDDDGNDEFINPTQRVLAPLVPGPADRVPRGPPATAPRGGPVTGARPPVTGRWFS
ncbi:DUF4389 domain-containing protein [Kitasatospora sp. NPDC091276]|uniref:DUF4389 domain-containing protein n=1 Tax=Kitasatospora sp. NPDC091276 TaxID=3155300 RepID=UPI00342E5F58